MNYSALQSRRTREEGSSAMGILQNISRAYDAYDKHVQREVRRARSDRKYGQQLLKQWGELIARIPSGATPTGVILPRLALPEIEEGGEIGRYVLGQGLAGEFPFVNSAYREMYLEPPHAHEGNGKSNGKPAEEPTRLFAGLGLAEDTNARFHYLTKHQK